jgi:hypothetical protein
MRDLTVILAYYENPTMLEHQLGNLLAMAPDIHEHLTLIVVDDGSPTAPALPVMEMQQMPFKTKLFRMDVDIPWNQDACRNLGVKHAKTDWLLLTDMDHVPPEKTLRTIMTAKLKPDTFYSLERVSAPDLTSYKPHPNSYIINRTIYRLAGGYDERWAGVYGTDGAFRTRINAIANWKLFPAPLIRFGRETIPDASTTKYERRSDENALLKDQIGAKIRAEGGPPITGRFSWTQQL